MILVDNQPLNVQATDQDFTIDSYRQLIRVALASYPKADYRSVPWGQRFLLWRHDCDFSVHRSLALARIEAEECLRSTFFLNPHSEFYNLFESSQLAFVKEVVRLGHDIGLHFDSTFYATSSENELDEQVAREAGLLEQFIGIRPAAFSFHNPSAFHLNCEADTYGGLVNCYSKRFKTEVAYCSDSNGYWRFRRLHDVLNEASDPCLQVLTHPGWWQDKPMPPRQRVFRSAYGRARANIARYDKNIEIDGRENLAGAAQAIRFLERVNTRLFELCDYLWNTEQFPTLFIELWRLHEWQISRLCRAVLSIEWRVPTHEVDAFFDHEGAAIDGWVIFKCLLGDTWRVAGGESENTYGDWGDVRNELLRGRGSLDPSRLEEGCVYLCALIEKIAAWGNAQAIADDGLPHLRSTGLPLHEMANGRLAERIEEVGGDISAKAWDAFKRRILTETGWQDGAKDTQS